MSSFFYQQAQVMIAKHIDSYPLLKLSQVLDWQPIEQLLHQQKTRYIRDHRGRPAYPLLPMFKAVLLGQWHSLSDPELERCLVTRLDFYFFCNFDDIALPNHSILLPFPKLVDTKPFENDVLEPVKSGQQASCTYCCLKNREYALKKENKDKHGRELPFKMTKRLFGHPSNRFDKWVAILQRSQPSCSKRPY